MPSSRSVPSLRMPRFANRRKSPSPGVVKSLQRAYAASPQAAIGLRPLDAGLIGCDPLAVLRERFILGRSQCAQCYHGCEGSVA